jgi:hypothetical protein
MLVARTLKVIGGFAGCSLAAVIVTAQKLDVESHRDRRADFAAIRTYTWLPAPPATSDVAPDAVQNPDLSQKVLGPHIVAAIDRELASRGLKQIDRGEPDVRVVYYAALHIGMDTHVLGSYYQYTTGWTLPGVPASTTSLSVYERGSVIVDVVDRTNTAIWRGSVGTRVNQENTLDKRIARINEGIARMFKHFPVARVSTP